MNKRIGVFIPARLNSERLPNKQLLSIGDSCLFDIACKKLNSLSDRYAKYVLVNDKELIAIASRYENIQIIKRDNRTCRADGPLTYIFKELESLKETHLMFLNPCLIFLKAETIERTLYSFCQGSTDYATSVKAYQNWVFKPSGDAITPIDYKTLSTKEIPLMYEAAHCFHIFNKSSFFQDGMMLKPGCALYLISKEEAIDIDTREDYEYARWRYEQARFPDKGGLSF